MEQIEREVVYLLKKLPSDINKCKSILIRVGDVSGSNKISALRIKQKGNKFELIRKEGKTTHKRIERSIECDKEEFEILWKVVKRKHRKYRYLYPYKGHTIEIDLYKDELQGYVRAEVEFKSNKEMKNFIPPPWFAEDMTKLNHRIHKGLGEITFKDMKERFKKKGIVLKKIKK